MSRLFRLATSRYKSIPLPARATIWFVVCSVLQRGVSFITTPIFTRTLSQYEYGTVSLYNTWESVILILATLELSSGCYNKAMIKFPEDRDGYTSSILTLSSLVTILLYAVYFLFRRTFNPLIGLSTELVTMMFIQIFFSMANSMLLSRKKFDYDYKTIVGLTLFISISSTLLSLFFVLTHDSNRDYYKIFGYLIVIVAVNVFIFIYLLFKGKKTIDWRYWKYALAINIPLVPHYLSQQVLNQSDRIMISSMCGKEDVAVYTVAYQIAAICLLLINAVHSSFTPWCYKAMKMGNYQGIAKRTFQLSLFIGFGCLLFPLFAPEAIYILGGENYMRAVYIVPPVAMSVLFVTLYTFFSMVQFYYEKTKIIMLSSCSVAILNIVLNYIFIKQFGFVAAGYTTVFCYIIYALIHFLYTRKIAHKEKIPLPFEAKKMWVMALTFTVISILSTFLYSLTILRYIVIAFLFVIMVIFGKKNKNTLLGKE